MLDARCILHLCKKGKEAEGRVLDQLGDIAETIAADLAIAIKRPIESPLGKSANTSKPAASPSAAASVESVL